MGNTEHDAHAAQPVHEGEEFELNRFMIFMTDGDNNYSSDDTETKALCDQYKADGIEIYSVAFEAPSGRPGSAGILRDRRGALLRCRR